MLIGGLFLVGLTLAQASTSQPPSPPPSQPLPCAQALGDAATDGAASDICAGDDALRLGNAAPKGSSQQRRQWEAAAAHYRKAATNASKPATKLLALNQLAACYDTQLLNDLKEMESVLREIIQLTPDDLAPVYRLARVLEDEGLLDAAEEMLLDAHRKQPESAEPCRVLAQYYARRVTALTKQAVQSEPRATSNPGEPDASGVYRIGGALPSPPRLDLPRYSDDARAAGIQGVVVAEVIIDPSGNVTDARIVQSIPMLDEQALLAVRNWRFTPTMVNGVPVPVRMNVNVNFSLR
jgi:TonB family protein